MPQNNRLTNLADVAVEFIDNKFMQYFKNSDIISRTFLKPRGEAIIPYKFTTRARIFDAPPLSDTAQRICGYLQEVMLTGTKYKAKGCSDSDVIYHSNFEQIKNSMLCQHASEALYDRKWHYWELSEQGKGNLQHDTVQNHLMFADNYCIATEIPVYSDKHDRSGFIDILRYWDDRLMICDFKPNAHLEKVNKVMTQLIWYKELLSERTGIDAKLIDCLYFDRENCYKLI